MVRPKGVPATLQSFNGSKLLGGFAGDPEYKYAGMGDSLGFRDRPCTTQDMFYIPISDPDAVGSGRENASLGKNITVNTWGIGAEMVCTYVPLKNMVEWTIFRMPTETLDSDLKVPLENLTATFLTLTPEGAPSTLLEGNVVAALTDVFPFHSETLYSYLSSNLTNGPVYFEVVPESCFPDAGPWDLTASWSEFRTKNATVKINQAVWDTDSQFYDFERSIVNTSVIGLHAYPTKTNYFKCSAQPHLVQAIIVVDASGMILAAHHGSTVPTDSDPTFGVSGLLTAFHTRLLTLGAHPLTWKTDLRPSAWIELMVRRQAAIQNPLYDPYISPASETIAAIEAMYRQMFKIYLQLHMEDIFSASAVGPSSRTGATATYAVTRG